jgi:hypothetical protein
MQRWIVVTLRLRCLIGSSSATEAPADGGLGSIRRGFDEGPPAISLATLPSGMAMLFDCSTMVIALRRPRLTRHSC